LNAEGKPVEHYDPAEIENVDALFDSAVKTGINFEKDQNIKVKVRPSFSRLLSDCSP
jgi:hypothetical protein